MESRACTACAKARRSCDKHKPHCLRCRTRGNRCEYPPSKPTSFVRLREQAPELAYTPLSGSTTSFGPMFSLFSSTQVHSWWFASPETWTIDQVPPNLLSAPHRFSSADLDRHLRTMILWLAEWVTQGSNPFIHQQLYRHRLPRCIQSAYTALSAYLNKTASNEQMICRIIEDQVVLLVGEGVPRSESVLGAANSSERKLDILEYLARVQALLVYQCIGFFDGNHRLRHLAEKHIPILQSWLVDLLEYTRQAECCGESLMSSPNGQATFNIDTASESPNENLLWYSWVLIESTRRTWLIASGIQGMYQLIQRRMAACMGGTIFTSRQGFWEAPTALVWEKRCSEVYAGLVRLTEIEKLFAMVPKREINEFAKLVLECPYGDEQVERW
ncbi:hypothetical protein P153DRAFT_254081, partial [Dothidotthia symphoricarpi CBS 119687]